MENKFTRRRRRDTTPRRRRVCTYFAKASSLLGPVVASSGRGCEGEKSSDLMNNIYTPLIRSRSKEVRLPAGKYGSCILPWPVFQLHRIYMAVRAIIGVSPLIITADSQRGFSTDARQFTYTGWLFSFFFFLSYSVQCGKSKRTPALRIMITAAGLNNVKTPPTSDKKTIGKRI